MGSCRAPVPIMLSISDMDCGFDCAAAGHAQRGVPLTCPTGLQAEHIPWSAPLQMALAPHTGCSRCAHQGRCQSLWAVHASPGHHYRHPLGQDHAGAPEDFPAWHPCRQSTAQVGLKPSCARMPEQEQPTAEPVHHQSCIARAAERSGARLCVMLRECSMCSASSVCRSRSSSSASPPGSVLSAHHHALGSDSSGRPATRGLLCLEALSWSWTSLQKTIHWSWCFLQVCRLNLHIEILSLAVT